MLVRVVELGPVEVFLMERGQALDVHPGGACVLRSDIDGSGEGNERELYGLCNLLDLRGLQRKGVDELLGRRLEQRKALLAGTGAVFVHGAGVVEDERDFERVEADLAVRREAEFLVTLVRGLSEQAEERRQEIRLVVQHR